MFVQGGSSPRRLGGRHIGEGQTPRSSELSASFLPNRGFLDSTSGAWWFNKSKNKSNENSVYTREFNEFSQVRVARLSK